MRIITTVLRSVFLVATILSISFPSFSKSTDAGNVTTASIQKVSSDDLSNALAESIFVKADQSHPSVFMAGIASEDTSNDGIKTRINWLLFIVAALLVIVIGQVFSILSKVGEIQGKPVLNWSNLNAKLLLAFLVIGMGAAFWEFIVHGKLTVNAQDAASEHGATYDSMFTITLIITGIVFVITQVLLFWYGYKYKHSEKRKALYYPDNHKIEFIWTIIPAVVLTVLVIRGLKTWNNIMNHRDPKATVIEVFGYQFGWTARYAGLDNKLGNHDFRQIGVINALGVDPKDPKSQDDIAVSELHFEVGKAVSLKFRAKDVIHSAYLPHFRVQMNVVPGLPTQFNFTPTITTSEMRNKLNNPKFDYVLLCNKICGGAHYRMKMKVVVDTHEEYIKWMQEQPKLVSSEPPAAPSDSLAAPAGEQASVVTEPAKTLASK